MAGKNNGAYFLKFRIAVFVLIAFAVNPLIINVSSADSRPDRENTDPDFITLGVGGFDVNDNETAAQLEIQARLNTRFWIFKPQVGMFITTEHGSYAYMGLLVDAFFGNTLVLSPSFSVGVNHEGEGKQLGGAIEFRSALEFAYRFSDRSRLGIQIGHLSNAGIYSENPGTEFAILNYSLPTTVFSR